MYITHQIYDHIIAIPLEDFKEFQEKLIYLEGYGEVQKVVSSSESGFEIKVLTKLPDPEDPTAKIFKTINQLSLENEKLRQQVKELKQLCEDK